ncbi:MAG: deaminase [Sphingorhabdus sp.]
MTNENREAFIALIAPIGINMEQVVRVITEKSKQISYEPNVIKLTDSLVKLDRVTQNYNTEIERYKEYIKAGDEICKEAGRGDILAMLGIAEILSVGPEQREKDVGRRRLNIIRQIKRLEEYRTLERVYGRNIIFVGCFASQEDRVNYIVDKLKVADRGSSNSKLESQALEIISIDEDETNQDYGQKIIECYPKSDFILDCTSLKTLESSCERLFEIYFGHPFISPTVDEYASCIANAAAYRSLDLSRQVGAAIFGDSGEIISMGCNEIPAPFGGTYWCHHTNDARDYILGYDSNQRVREDMARDALFKLKEAGWLSDDFKDRELNDLVSEVFKKKSVGDEKPDGPWRQSMISDIIEYGRMVHAEMNALADAARFRRSTQGATLYCTTMPCHMCTKLIIAAGIKRVVYVQPYVKSLTKELYKDSVVFESEKENYITFCTLKGVTPAGFKRAFSKSSRRKKDDGSAIIWDKLNASPNFLTTIPYYTTSEREVLYELQKIFGNMESEKQS